MKRSVILTMLLAICGIMSCSICEATFQFSVVNPTGGAPNFTLAPGPAQQVQIFINSTSAADTLGSLKFRIQVGDGAGALAEPPMVSVTPGAFFAGFSAGGGPSFDPTNSQLIYDLTNLGAPVSFAGNQLAATLTLNTSAFANQGPFNFSFANSVGSSTVNNPAGIEYGGTVLSGGSFVVAIPEPSSFALLGVVGLGVCVARRFRKKDQVSQLAT